MVETVKERIIERYSHLTNNKRKFSESVKKPLKQAFRINTIKADIEAVISKIKEYDGTIENVKWCENAFQTKLTNLGSSIQHFTGQIYIQELTSMIPPIIVSDLIQDNKILDCCAAPGSKTTQIADIMGNKGHIIANDARYARIKALRGNLDRLGVTNTTVTLRDFKSFPNTKADIYFVDAPCSSEGTIRKKNALKRNWKEYDYERFSKMQSGLLNKACEMAPKGSTIVYSTCTFAPEENENVVNKIIEQNDVELKAIKLNGLKMGEGISSWKEKDFNKEVKKCVRIWPHHNDTDAFFLARMEKC